MFYSNWGLQFYNGMFGMMNPYMFFGMQNPFMFNPYMMRINMMQSLFSNMFGGSRACNCNHRQNIQFVQRPVQQIVRSNVQPIFNNIQFESIMPKPVEINYADIFKRTYDTSFKSSGNSEHIKKFDAKDLKSENIFEKPKKSVTETENTNAKVKNEKKPVIKIENKQIASIVHKKAEKYGVDENLILAMIAQESGFVNGRTSVKGAKGLMQLMPATARELGVTDVNDPEQNIDAGVRYMKQLLDMYGGDVKKALAAYNGGMGNVNDILNGTNKCGNNPNLIKDSSGIPRMRETQNYVSKIYKNYKNGTLS